MPYPASTTYPGTTVYPGGEAPPVEPPAIERPTKRAVIVPALREGAVRTSHKVATRVDVLSYGAKIAEIDAVTGGSVSLDARAASRGRLELTVIDDGTMGWVPKSKDDLLAPFGNELRVLRGVEHSDQIELISLGIFGIDRVSTQDTGAGIEVSVSGLDRSQRFLDASFEAPGQIGMVPAGANVRVAAVQVADALLTLLLDAWADLPYEFTPSDMLLPMTTYEEGGDRWGLCLGLATYMGGELFFDDNGILRLLPTPDGAGPAVASFAEGIDGILLSLNREWDRANTYNRVIVTGENTSLDSPVPRGVATDSDPSSPTYWDGPFGHKPYFLASRYALNDAGATVMATNLLRKTIGAPDMISFGSVVDPARRPGDIVTIERPLSIPAGQEKHILDQVTIPLTAEGEMQAQTRVAQILITD